MVDGAAFRLPAPSPGPPVRKTSMLTEDQATENMAYLRRLLRRNQPRFAAALELAAALVEQELNSLPEVACHRAAERTPSDRLGSR
jgi:hypothetical protein